VKKNKTITQIDCVSNTNRSIVDIKLFS